MKYLISVIVPNYNSGEFTYNLFISLQKQVFQNFEIIVIDKISKDNSLESVKQSYSFFKNRLRIFSAEDNGIYDAMNKGIKYSRGSWLYFIGANDFIYSELTFSVLSNFLKNTSSNVVYGNVLVKGETGWANDGDVYDGEFTLSKLFKKNICHQAIFYNRAIFDMYGAYKICYRICADYDLNLRFFAKSKFEFVPIIVAVFSGGGESTKIWDRAFFKDKYRNIIKYYNQFPYRYLFKEILKSSQISFIEIIKLAILFIGYKAYKKWKGLILRH
jgi:glycosyltransferase involved in cell wall biosynthesis